MPNVAVRTGWRPWAAPSIQGVRTGKTLAVSSPPPVHCAHSGAPALPLHRGVWWTCLSCPAGWSIWRSSARGALVSAHDENSGNVWWRKSIKTLWATTETKIQCFMSKCFFLFDLSQKWGHLVYYNRSQTLTYSLPWACRIDHHPANYFHPTHHLQDHNFIEGT